MYRTKKAFIWLYLDYGRRFTYELFTFIQKPPLKSHFLNLMPISNGKTTFWRSPGRQRIPKCRKKCCQKRVLKPSWNSPGATLVPSQKVPKAAQDAPEAVQNDLMPQVRQIDGISPSFRHHLTICSMHLAGILWKCPLPAEKRGGGEGEERGCTFSDGTFSSPSNPLTGTVRTCAATWIIETNCHCPC